MHRECFFTLKERFQTTHTYLLGKSSCNTRKLWRQLELSQKCVRVSWGTSKLFEVILSTSELLKGILGLPQQQPRWSWNYLTDVKGSLRAIITTQIYVHRFSTKCTNKWEAGCAAGIWNVDKLQLFSVRVTKHTLPTLCALPANRSSNNRSDWEMKAPCVKVRFWTVYQREMRQSNRVCRQGWQVLTVASRAIPFSRPVRSSLQINKLGRCVHVTHSFC